MNTRTVLLCVMHGIGPTSSPTAALGPGIPLAPDFPWRKYFVFSTPELLKQLATNAGSDCCVCFKF